MSKRERTKIVTLEVSTMLNNKKLAEHITDCLRGDVPTFEYEDVMLAQKPRVRTAQAAVPEGPAE